MMSDDKALRHQRCCRLSPTYVGLCAGGLISDAGEFAPSEAFLSDAWGPFDGHGTRNKMLAERKRIRNSELLKLLDSPGTWVVRARSGAIGNGGSLRTALELAARKSSPDDPLQSILSITRFEDRQIEIPRRQLLELMRTTQLED